LIYEFIDHQKVPFYPQNPKVQAIFIYTNYYKKMENMQNTSVNENKNLPQTNCKADKNLNKTPQ
jgi:hypothetical protein